MPQRREHGRTTITRLESINYLLRHVMRGFIYAPAMELSTRQSELRRHPHHALGAAGSVVLR